MKQTQMAQLKKRETSLFDLIAGTVAFLGILGLIFILAQSVFQSAWAQPPGGDDGFRPGSRPIGNGGANNPFAPGGAPGKSSNFFDDDEDDDFQNFGGGFPANPPGGGAPQGGDDKFNNPFSNSDRAQGQGAAPTGKRDVSFGGQQNGGIITKNKQPNLGVDSETAEGSKEIVTDFNFPDADIMDIAKTLGKLTGKNFILDKDVKGKITIISNAPITVGDAWKAFLTALDINGFALIPSGKYIRVARQRDARDKQLKTYTGDYSPDTDALITRVFPLKYLSADEVARNFRSFMPANSRIIPYDQTNTVIVTDTGSNIQKLQKLLEILDVEGYDAGIEVIPVKYASASELSKLIDSLLPGTPAGGAGGAGAPRFGGGGRGSFNARRTKEGGIINTIIADERTNTLIVHANSKGADQVRELISKLDQRQPSNVGGGKVHVIYLQFADAEAIGNTLNNLTSQSSNRTGGSPMGGGGGGTGVNPQQQSLFEGSIKVAPDKSTNALVVTASPADFVVVQRVINKLDIPRDQVFAEVVIMEVSLGNSFNFAVNIASPAAGVASLPSSKDLTDFITGGRLTGTGGVINYSGGKTQEITLPGGQKISVGSVEALVTAIQTTGYGNILATPQILTLDNTEATFESNEGIPVLTQTAIQGAGVSSSTTEKKISLSITIKPQINKLSNFVKLDIQAKLADRSGRPVPAAVQNLAFGTVERIAKTSVVVADKDTVVLGGLTRDDTRDAVNKVPILGDIPLLGWLFRSKTSEATKSNLLIFITPKIIRQYESIRMVLDKKLQERDQFLEDYAGGRDLARTTRDRMIRSLPDVKDITSYHAKKFQTIDRSAENMDDQDQPINPPSDTQTAPAPTTK